MKRELAAYTMRDFREFKWPPRWYQMAAWEQAELQAFENDLQRAYDAAAAAHGGEVESTPCRS